MNYILQADPDRPSEQIRYYVGGTHVENMETVANTDYNRNIAHTFSTKTAAQDFAAYLNKFCAKYRFIVVRQENTIESRKVIVNCANPGCRRPFVQRAVNNIYCCKACNLAAQKYRQKVARQQAAAKKPKNNKNSTLMDDVREADARGVSYGKRTGEKYIEEMRKNGMQA